MGCGVKEVYTLNGTASDIETIVRLRPWMEDEIKSNISGVTRTQLYTDYKEESETFEFKIIFYR